MEFVNFVYRVKQKKRIALSLEMVLIGRPETSVIK